MKIITKVPTYNQSDSLTLVFNSILGGNNMKIVKRDINTMQEEIVLEYVEEIPGLLVVEGLNKFNEQEGIYYQLVLDDYRIYKK